MSPTHAIELHLPQDWQVFERLCRDLVRAEWGGSAELHGRQGQGQDGVDVYAMSDGGYVAFQCKNKGQRSDAKLKPKEIKEDVRKAREFEPPLTKLIFATTAQRHTDTQATVRKINEAHREEDPACFTVEVNFWDDLVELLREHPRTYIRWRRRLSVGAGPEISTHRHSVGDRKGAREHLDVARKIVEETGYGRREREVRELSEALG